MKDLKVGTIIPDLGQTQCGIVDRSCTLAPSERKESPPGRVQGEVAKRPLARTVPIKLNEVGGDWITNKLSMRACLWQCLFEADRHARGYSLQHSVRKPQNDVLLVNHEGYSQTLGGKSDRKADVTAHPDDDVGRDAPEQPDRGSESPRGLYADGRKRPRSRSVEPPNDQEFKVEARRRD
jgi:hypothetical protein